MAIFVVRIEKNDMTERMFIQDGLQDDAHGAGFASARRPKHRKMLAEKAVGQDEGRHLWIMPKLTDMDVRGGGTGIDRADVAAGHRCDRGIQRRIAGNASLKAPP